MFFGSDNSVTNHPYHVNVAYQPVIAKLLAIVLGDLTARSRLRYKRVALSGSAAVGVRVFTAVLGLVTVPLVMNHVGKDQFGLWMLVTSLVVWMQLVDFGVTQGLTNALAEASGRDDSAAACGYLTTAVVSTIALVFLCLPLIGIGYALIPWGYMFDSPQSQLGDMASKLMIVVAILFVANIPLSLSERVLAAYQKGYLASLCHCVAGVASFLCVVWAVRAELGLVWIAALYAATPLVSSCLMWFIIPWSGIPIGMDRSRISWTSFRRLAHSSSPLFVFQCGALLLNQLVNAVIATVATLSMVADYNVIQRVYLFVFALGVAVAMPFYPAIREAYERRDDSWVRSAILRCLLVRLAMVAPFVVVFLAAGDWLIKAWMGEAMSTPLYRLGWACVSLSLLLSSVSSTLSEALTSLDEIWIQIGMVLSSAIVVLGLMFFLVQLFGVAGVYLAMILATPVPIFWCWARLQRKLASRES